MFELTQEQIEELIPTLGRPDPKNQFEAELIETHRRYLRDGMALVIKMPVPKIATGKRYKTKGGAWRGTFAIPTNPTVADYFGILATGSSVVFDAKEHEAESRRGFRFTHSDARPHQWLALRMLEDWGIPAFFIVSVLEGGQAQWCALVKPSWIEFGQGVDLQECVKVQRDENGHWRWLPYVLGYEVWEELRGKFV